MQQHSQGASHCSACVCLRLAQKASSTCPRVQRGARAMALYSTAAWYYVNEAARCLHLKH